MKIDAVRANNHRAAFEVRVDEQALAIPYAHVETSPSREDPVVRLFVDEELGSEGFTYVLRSGAEGSVHIDDVLEYNQDPNYMRELLLYRLTLEAQRCVEESRLSKREIIRRLDTSPSQFYRLLDPTNTTKTVDRLLELFASLDCEVEVSVRQPTPR